MSASRSPSPEHEVLTFLRVRKELDDLVQGIPLSMEINSDLSKALDAVSCTPFIQFPLMLPLGTINEYSFTIAGAPAGTLGQPDVDLILQKSTPSQFGRGEENITDTSYRNGREIPGADIELTKGWDHSDNVIRDVNTTMFPGRQAELKLYKLAVYEDGGHFDWHRDSTHSDKHHATLLIALNTSWEGGDLVLRRNSTETRVDLRPQSGHKEGTALQVVAFFTDTEHRVEPITKGTRIVLQYDIDVMEPKDEDEKNEEEHGQLWLDTVSSDFSDREQFEGVAQAVANKDAVEKVIAIITELHESGVEDVGFALRYLYRKESISPKYLKDSDAIIYNALLASESFKVSLHPVVLQEVSDMEGLIDQHNAFLYDKDMYNNFRATKKAKKSREFHIPKLSAIEEISSQEYIEHTGNEAMPAEYRYFGGAMVVRPKQSNQVLSTEESESESD